MSIVINIYRNQQTKFLGLQTDNYLNWKSLVDFVLPNLHVPKIYVMKYNMFWSDLSNTNIFLLQKKVISIMVGVQKR
jgi:hypothetical protein